jgi:hypothetical protein
MAGKQKVIINRRGGFSQTFDEQDTLASVAEALEVNDKPIILLSIEDAIHPITEERMKVATVRSNRQSIRALEFMKESLIDYIEHMKSHQP